MGKARHKVSPEQLDRLVELREIKGWSPKRIAPEIGLPEATVKWVCLRDGLIGTTHAVTAIGPVMIITRDGKPMRRFTPAEDARIQLLRRALSLEAIAEQTGRARSSIAARLLTLARRDENPQRFRAARGQAIGAD